MSLSSKVFSACFAAGCLVTACGSQSASYPASGASQSAGISTQAATATRGGEFGALNARGVVTALSRAGFAAPNPVDTTAQECPTAGCDQTIVTDTVRVLSFPTTSRAETYAADHGLHQVETVVVAFAPPLSEADQARYWTEIESLVR